MGYISKAPILREKRLVILVILAGILLGGLPIAGLFIPKTEAQLNPDNAAAIQPKTGLILSGDNTLIPVTNLSKDNVNVTKKIKVVVTAYSSTVEQTDSDPYITASGSIVREGIVATNILPFGTKIRMPEIYGNKVFVVEDRMHPKQKYQVDIWFPSSWQALNFGAKRSYVEVLEN